MRSSLLLWLGILAFHPAFPQAILSNVYAYTHVQAGIEEQTLLEGATRDFSHLIAQVITVGVNQPAQLTQQFDEETMLIIKTGELTLTLGSKRKSLGPGSVVMIMPGDDYGIENRASQPITYYRIRYTSNEMPDLDLYRLVGESFWIDWQEVASTIDQQGSSKRVIPYPTVMSNRISMQITTIGPGFRGYSPHTHRAAELLLSVDNPVKASIEGAWKVAQAGDLIFIESDVSHGINTISPGGCTYLSIQF